MKKEKMKISKSTKIHIRREKQRIRQAGRSLEEQQSEIAKLYETLGITKQNDNK